MAIYLIDYENVRTSAFNGLEGLTADDSVFVFYTNNSDNLTFSLMQRLAETKAKVEYKRVSCGGKNSLDFQLCSFLGYLIGTHTNTRFSIVSRDKGFATMLSLWGDGAGEGNSVACCVNILGGMDASASEAEEAEDKAEEAVVKAALPEPAAPAETAEENEVKEAPKPRKRRTYKRKPKAPAAEQTA